MRNRLCTRLLAPSLFRGRPPYDRETAIRPRNICTTERQLYDRGTIADLGTRLVGNGIKRMARRWSAQVDWPEEIPQSRCAVSDRWDTIWDTMLALCGRAATPRLKKFALAGARRVTTRSRGIIAMFQADGEGFEPPEPLRVRRFSKPVP